MGVFTPDSVKNTPLNGKAESFRARGWLSLETISIDKDYLIYKKRSTVLAPMFTLTIPRQSIKTVEYLDTLSGALLKITTFSNNNIISKSFTKSSVKRIKELLRR